MIKKIDITLYFSSIVFHLWMVNENRREPYMYIHLDVNVSL